MAGQARVYWLRTNGAIEKTVLDPTVFELNDLLPRVNHGHSYLLTLGQIWFAMHDDNDLPDSFNKSRLPINRALQSMVPQSPYVGDILVVKTRHADTDEIDRHTDWTLSNLFDRYEVWISGYDHHLGFVPKDDDDDESII